jgi:phosphatidylserine decarboxylase
VVLGRIVVLKVSSGCLNTGSRRFHMVLDRKIRVVAWCKGEQFFSTVQVGACVTRSCCFHLISARTLRELVFPSSGCYTNQRVGNLNKLHIIKQRW